MVVTEYHKSLVTTDQTKVVPRFLPERVGKMLVTYLSDVFPFRQLMDRKAGMLGTQGISMIADRQTTRLDDGVQRGDRHEPVIGPQIIDKSRLQSTENMYAAD